jgi:hypothetical protein
VTVSPPASQLVLRALRGSAPGLARAVVGTLLDPQRRRAIAAALARFEADRLPVLPAIQRHPLTPAAVRVERTRSRRRWRGEAEQVAVTMWFGEGPALPMPGRMSRGAVRVGAGVASAAALAAATTLVTRVAERPPAALRGAPAADARIDRVA